MKILYRKALFLRCLQPDLIFYFLQQPRYVKIAFRVNTTTKIVTQLSFTFSPASLLLSSSLKLCPLSPVIDAHPRPFMPLQIPTGASRPSTSLCAPPHPSMPLHMSLCAPSRSSLSLHGPLRERSHIKSVKFNRF